MDPRIKALVEQAFLDETNSESSDALLNVNIASIQKVAELIIQESVDALDKESEKFECGGDYANGYSHGFEHAINFLEAYWRYEQISNSN